MKEVDVLAVGAHMGDEVACGMALAAHRRQGARIGFVHFTPGEKGHPTMDPEEYAAQKHQEAKACAEVLGAEVWVHDYKDGELPCDDEAKLALARNLREARPSVILTHWHGSMHKDHTNTAKMFPDANFYAGLKTFDLGVPHHWTKKLLYGENWEDLRGYNPEIWLEVTAEDIKVWEEAMRCYALFRGEWETFEYLEYYKALARSRGCENRTEFAVTFSQPPEQHNRRVKSLL